MSIPPMISVLLLLLLPSLTTGLYDGGTEANHVRIINSISDFESQIIDSDSICLVQFYDPAHPRAKAFAPTFTTLASQFRGIVPVAAIDTTAPENAYTKTALNGNDGPVVLMLFGKDKSQPLDLSDVTKDPEAIRTRTMRAIEDVLSSRGGTTKGASGSSDGSGGEGSKPASRVQIVTTANIKEKIYDNPLVSAIAFIAPWCGHCKSLLPEWASASVRLHGSGAVLGVVDATVEEELAQEYGVKGFPTIKMFPGGVKSGASAATEYRGGREERDIVRVMLEEVDRSGVPKEIPELVDGTVMEETCVGDGSTLCVLFGLPHILESGAEGRTKYKEIIGEATRAVRGMNFGFAWFEGGSEQYKLEEALGLNFGFPAVVAYSNKKGVYIMHRGSFNVPNIRKFLTGLTSGKQQTYPISEVPVVKTVEPWDGKDGVPIEEESLADLMGDDWNDEF